MNLLQIITSLDKKLINYENKRMQCKRFTVNLKSNYKAKKKMLKIQ